MLKKIVLSRIAIPVLDFLTAEALTSVGKAISNVKRRKFKKQFLISLDTKLLRQYGNSTFYYKLSELINSKGILNKIYNHCYIRNYYDFQTDSQFMDSIIKNSGAELLDRIYLKNALEYIFNKIDYVLNQTDSEEGWPDPRKRIRVESEKMQLI